MNKLTIVVVILISVGLSAAQSSPGRATSPSPQENKHVTQHATGPFEVKVSPQKPDNEVAQAANIGRFSLDKVYHGDLEGTSKGEMLAAGDPKTSAGAVAMERVTGTLKGRKGSFVLQHTGTINRGVQSQWEISVVPDSGTDELKGLIGKMKIIIAADGKHSYDFDYSPE
jgi:hypothetical protein